MSALSAPADPAELDAWVNSLSAKQLKDYITAQGMKYADCVEKSDLRARAHEAANRAAAKNVDHVHVEGTHMPKKGLTHERRTIGPYQTIIASDRGAPKCDAVMAVLHGYGASCDDFLPFAEEMSGMPQLKGKHIMYAMPQAPGFPPEWYEASAIS